MLRRRSAGPAPQATPKGGSSQCADERILRIPDARAVLAGTKGLENDCEMLAVRKATRNTAIQQYKLNILFKNALSSHTAQATKG